MTEQRISFSDGRNAQASALDRMTAHVTGQLPSIASILAGRRPIFVGMGASYAACAVPVRILARAGIDARRVLACDLEPGLALPPADVVLAVSQSGRSIETLTAIEMYPATSRVALTNITPSALTEVCPLSIDLGNEPDSYASTVAFIGTVMGLELSAAALVGQSGSGVAGVDALASAESRWLGAGERLARFTQAVDPTLAEFAALCTGVVAADVIGVGAHCGTAEEGALLLREVSRIPSSVATTRNYLHGQMESAGRTMHVIVGSGREVPLARELARAGHPTLLMTRVAIAGEDNLRVIELPDGDERVGEQVVAATVVLQKLAAELAELRGVDVEEFVFANPDTKIGPVAGRVGAADVRTSRG